MRRLLTSRADATSSPRASRLRVRLMQQEGLQHVRSQTTIVNAAFGIARIAISGGVDKRVQQGVISPQDAQQ